jgi:hypothetical protein
MPRDAHVSLLAHFRPPQLHAVAAWLTRFLEPIEDVVLRLDDSRGNLELSNVRGVDLRLLTDHLYQHGARCVFVRYQHEGRRVSIAYGSDDGREPTSREAPRDPRLN